MLASRSGLTASEFRQAYTRALPGGAISLRETSRGACVFFVAGQGCSVYEDRPRQCRTWPFWKQVVETRESWNREAVECPGMNHGPLHAATEIIATSERDGTSRDSGERS